MTGRHTADTINDNDLDQLYDQLARAEAELADMTRDRDRQQWYVGENDRKRKVQRGRADQAEAELARLRAGEEDGHDPLAVPTPGQWIHQFNQATAPKRLEVVGRLIDAAGRSEGCTWQQHEARIHEGRHAEMALTEVRQVVADMEATTGARTWAGWLRDAMKRGPDHCLLCATEPKPEPAAGPAATEATELETTARVFAGLHRSAEQDVTRVIELYERWVKEGAPPLGIPIARWWDKRLVELHDAISPPTNQTKEKATMDQHEQTERRADIADDVTRHTKELMARRTETLRARAEGAEQEQDGAYRERARLVALVAGGLAEQAVVAPASDVDEPGWQILYATLHGRQCSWHFSPRDADLIEFFDHVPVDDPRAQWDGHTTEAKYEHIDYLARALGSPGPFRKR
jgi:hypothetical protein